MQTVLLRVGRKAFSAMSAVEAIVVQAPETDVDLRCGGEPMVLGERTPLSGSTYGEGESVVGLRYWHDVGLEVLCTAGGAGALSIGDDPMRPRGGAGVREPRRPGPTSGSGSLEPYSRHPPGVR